MSTKKEHRYKINNTWTGNHGLGTKNYKSYERSYEIISGNKKIIQGSSDPAFQGDPTLYNPEELFLASIASCHMLWFLHLCSVNNVIVISYTDNAEGSMEENKNGSGQFSEVILRPKITVKDLQMVELANQLHEKANKMCFIANSCNFPIKHEAETTVDLL